jgi:hypothetical protein
MQTKQTQLNNAKCECKEAYSDILFSAKAEREKRGKRDEMKEIK